MKEIWKIIVDYPNYSISNLGNVKSMPREVLMKNGVIRKNKGRVLKKVINSKGYPVVTLHNDRGQKVCRVHRLVAESFINGRTSERNQINHIDGNKVNNNYTNLEWCSQYENNHHGYRTGLIVQLKNEDHPLAKLTNVEVSKVKKLLKQGMKHKDIAEIFGVPKWLITRINTGKTYKDIK